MANSKYKTRLCFWGEKCHSKKKCHFAHTIEELRPLDKIQQPCTECICKGTLDVIYNVIIKVILKVLIPTIIFNVISRSFLRSFGWGAIRN